MSEISDKIDDGLEMRISFMYFSSKGTQDIMRSLVLPIKAEGVRLEPDPREVEEEYDGGGRIFVERLLSGDAIIGRDIVVKLTPERYKLISLDFKDENAPNLFYSATGKIVFKPRDSTGDGTYSEDRK